MEHRHSHKWRRTPPFPHLNGPCLCYSSIRVDQSQETFSSSDSSAEISPRLNRPQLRPRRLSPCQTDDSDHIAIHKYLAMAKTSVEMFAIVTLGGSLFYSLAAGFSLPSAYAPVTASCPSTPLVRAASGISSPESIYATARKSVADTSLAAWLKKTDSSFPSTSLPSVGLTTSGGGYRSLLTGAGVIQGFDSRDSNIGTSGVFQGLTYQAGLSGGAWLLSSFAGNNYPTITSLKTSLWETAFQDSILDPEEFLAAAAYAEVFNDLSAKNAAGFPPTLTDPYGRLLSYQLLKGFDGGVTDRLSGIASVSNFSSHNVPYPIITSLGVQETNGQCEPSPNGTQYELHPYEFGSWDEGVAAFTNTAYLGSSLSNGAPTKPGVCKMNYDNLGYVLGTSSNLFNEACISVNLPGLSSSSFSGLAALLEKIHSLALRDEYAVYPNPFYQRPTSSLVASEQSLYLVDGGETLQNNPICKKIQLYVLPAFGLFCNAIGLFGQPQEIPEREIPAITPIFL